VLAPKGIAQAKELAIELKGLERKIEKIYSSRFCRCIQTSEIIAEELGLEIYAEMGLGDWYSRQRKTHPVPAPPDALHRYFPRVQAEYQSVSSVDPTGETQQELYSRIKETLEKILTNEGDTNTLLIITHAATAIAIGHILTGNYEADIHTGTCSLSCYSTAKGEQMGNWSAEFTGKATFLSNGEVMNWSFGKSRLMTFVSNISG
jgi:transcription factor C subunit 7